MPNELKETDIRPDHLRARQREVMLQDVGRLLTRRDEFVDVPCPACDSASRSKAFEKYGMDYWVCSQCATMYISPRPSPAVLKWFYAGSVNYAFWHRYVFPASEAVRRERIFAPRVDRFLQWCEGHGVEPKKILEVGAAYGTFCAELRARRPDSRVVAVEPTPDLAGHCRSQGIETVETPVEELPADYHGTFDAVVSFEVLEHLFLPREFLRQCASLLRPNGMLVLTCPNARGFEIATLGALSDSVDAEHLNYFHPGSLRLLAGDCGLEVLEITTPGRLDAELVRKKIVAGEYDVSAQPFLREVLLDGWETLGPAFQEFLANNQQSSHMWMAARKVG